MSTTAGETPAAPAEPKPEYFIGGGTRRKGKQVRRPSSPATRFHHSKAAVDPEERRISKLDELQSMRELAVIRWGSYKVMPCPYCGTFDEHLWSEAESRWRCLYCKVGFSVTANTFFADRKRLLNDIMRETYFWCTGSQGMAALQTRRLTGNVSFNTSFVHIQKLREGLVRGNNTGFLCGVLEMDGAHASGHDAAGKRSKPQGGFRKTEEQEKAQTQGIIDAVNAKNRKRLRPAPGEPKPVRDPTYGNTYHENRRIVITIRRRSGVKGRGAMRTFVGVGMVESPDVIQALADRHTLMPESVLSTDSADGYSKVGRKFQLHVTVNHSVEMVGPDGENNNQAEGFTARQDRAESGIYLNIEPKYLHDYACETAFREDHRRLSTVHRYKKALFWSMNLGPSHYWGNYTHGEHREFEHLVPTNRSTAVEEEKQRAQLKARKPRPPR